MNRNLMSELTEGIDALAERRKMERDRLDERLGENQERVEQEEIFAPHMDEEQYINRNDLLKDYARIIDEQREEIKVLREGLSLAASNIGNGSGASPQASLEFLTVEVPAEIKLVCENYRREIKFLKDRNEKLSKRHPTTEEALAQYHWLKENSKRNK